jgi:hypothetical protein
MLSLKYLYITTYLIILPYCAVWTQVSSQTPFQQLEVPVLDAEFADWLEKTGDEWGLKGIAISVTRRLKDENGDWAGWTSEAKGFGVADRWGTPVNADVT